MRRMRLMKALCLGLALSAGRSAVALAQDPAPAPTPPAPAPAAAPAAPDTNMMWAGDWDYQISWRDSTIEGSWRLNYSDNHFTGVLTKSGVPPAPIRSFTLSRNKKDMNLSVDWNGQEVRFSGHLENPRSITGTVSMTGGFGRLIARKRSN